MFHAVPLRELFLENFGAVHGYRFSQIGAAAAKEVDLELLALEDLANPRHQP